MIRLFRLGLLIVTLAGLIGQSSAMAMALAAPASHHIGSVNAWPAAIECAQMPMASGQDKTPCKKISLQCMAAMGCSPLALTLPDMQNVETQIVAPAAITPRTVARLTGRTYEPEPDPPSILI